MKFQQRTAYTLKVLTVITIVSLPRKYGAWTSGLINHFPNIQIFYPLVLAASLFSTQGVLPFTPNLAYFTYVVVILTVLVVATLVVLFNWDLWFQPIVDYVIALLISKINDERPGGEEIRDASTTPKALKQSFLPRKLRNASLPTRWDLENGA